MIYTQLFEQLKAPIGELSNFKTIDYYNQQYYHTDDENAEAYPAVYIDFSNDFQWKDAGNKMQVAEGAIIALHIVEFDLKEDPIDVLNLGAELFKKLHGVRLFENDNQLTTALTRVSSGLVPRSKNLKIFKIAFRTDVFDTYAMDQGQVIPPNTVGFSIV